MTTEDARDFDPFDDEFVAPPTHRLPPPPSAITSAEREATEVLDAVVAAAAAGEYDELPSPTDPDQWPTARLPQVAPTFLPAPPATVTPITAPATLVGGEPPPVLVDAASAAAIGLAGLHARNVSAWFGDHLVLAGLPE